MLAEKELVSFATNGGDIEEFDRVHSAWCATEAWREKSGQFAPKLAEWIQDRGYTSMPPAAPLRAMSLAERRLQALEEA